MTERDPHEGCKNLAQEVREHVLEIISLLARLMVNPRCPNENLANIIERLMRAEHRLRDM